MGNRGTTRRLAVAFTLAFCAHIETVGAERIYWAQSVDDQILRADADGKNAQTLLEWPATDDVVGIAIDPVSLKIYWVERPSLPADLVQTRIRSADLNGANAQTLVQWPLVIDPTAIAVDPVGGGLYWAQGDGDQSEIVRADLNGDNPAAILVWPELTDPKAIAVDSIAGKIYWAQGSGESSSLRCANLDGLSVCPAPLLEYPLVIDPVGIDLDTAAGKIYWVQTFDALIARVDLDGSNDERLVEFPESYNPVGIAIDDVSGRFYWAQTDPDPIGTLGHKILRADLNGKNVEAVLAWPEVEGAVDLVLHLVAPGFCVTNGDCDDGQFCTGMETCVNEACQEGSSPCTAGETCDEINDVCDAIPCSAPVVSASGPRYLSLTPAPGNDAVAMLVTGDPIDSTVSCVSLYVQQPESACVGGGTFHGLTCATNADCSDGRCVTSAVLGPTRIQLTPAQWGTGIQIRGAEIRPSTVYRIQADCGVTPGEMLSPAAEATTWLWGDVNHDAKCSAGSNQGNLCNRDPECPGGSCLGVNFTDIGNTVEGFKGIFSDTITMEATDMLGCVPNRNVNFTDIGAAVDAFKSIAFTVSCDVPCGP